MSSNGSVIKRTLGLTGVTINAMALIAPGAFLWVTYQLQAANADGSGADMWTGIVAALVVAFLTAFAFAELARRYPDSGSGSAYYFAEKAFLDREQAPHRRWTRLVKFITGWASHLFHWVYPGVMVAFMATLITYLLGQFGIVLPVAGQVGVAILFSILVGTLAVRGISGSTTLSIVVNIIQLTTLILFSVLAIHFRNTNPLNAGAESWFHPDGLSIILPHNLGGLLFQATIGIMLLVGFESSTALAAEAKFPKRDIPRAVILSLIIQGVFAYLFQYFAANYALGSWLGADAAGRGIAAAAASSAPIGDMAITIGDTLLGGNGFALMLILAFSVGVAILATTLAAMNTAVRISFAMAQDEEMPEIMGLLHGKYATPYMGVVAMVIVSAIIGSVGVLGGVVTLTGVTLASNLGTFILYGIICGVTFVAFAGKPEFNRLRHGALPVVGLIANGVMVLALLLIGLASGGTTAQSTLLALGISVAWLLISLAYFVINSRSKGKPIVPPISAIHNGTRN